MSGYNYNDGINPYASNYQKFTQTFKSAYETPNYACKFILKNLISLGLIYLICLF